MKIERSTSVYNNPSYNFTGSTGWYTINLTTPFLYTGGSLQMAFRWHLAGSSTGSIKHYSHSAPQKGEGDASSSLGGSDDFGSGTYDDNRANIKKLTYFG